MPIGAATLVAVVALTQGTLGDGSSGGSGGGKGQLLLAAGTVTGRDAGGYNIGRGCSDDPGSSLPGCRDAPTIPKGGTKGTCRGRLTIDAQTTTCGLAENIRAAYRRDGLVTALSPERGRDYTLNCRTSGPGTSGDTICQGRIGKAPLYLRWVN